MKRLIEIFIAILIFTVLISNVNAEELNPVTLTDDFKFEMNLSWSDPSDPRYHNYQRAIDYYNTNCQGQNYIIGSFGNGYGNNEVDLVCLGEDNLNVSLSLVHYYQKNYYSLDLIWQDSYDIYTFVNADDFVHQDQTKKGAEIKNRCCNVNGENTQSSINSTFKYNIETNANFVLYNSTGKFPSTPSAYYWNSYYPVTANGTEYNINDTIFDSDGNFIKGDSIYENTQNSIPQMYSLDFYIHPEDDLNKFYYELDFTDTREDQTNKAYYSGLKLYGRINDGDIYHWEEITVTNDMLDTESDYNYSSLKENGFIEANAYKLNNLFSTYDRLKFSLQMTNAFQYELKITVPGKLENRIFENFIDSNYFVAENDSSINRYMIFTTKDDLLIEKIYVDQDKIYIDMFDTSKLEFTSYNHFDEFKQYNNWYYANYEIGLKNKTGFYLLSNKNEVINYNVLHSINLYYSYNNDDYLQNSIIIDDTGNIIQGSITTVDDLTPPASLGDAFGMLTRYIEKNTSTITNIISIPFNLLGKLNQEITIVLICVLAFFLLAVVVRYFWR